MKLQLAPRNAQELNLAQGAQQNSRCTETSHSNRFCFDHVRSFQTTVACHLLIHSLLPLENRHVIDVRHTSAERWGTCRGLALYLAQSTLVGFDHRLTKPVMADTRIAGLPLTGLQIDIILASLLCLNAVCVLHEERFLAKMGWGANHNIQGFGEQPTIKSQVLHLVSF
uniref:Immediate early response 3-interacting protein 1 n=1 Tax=Timema douglasi TaxID=61478 RepID=A0A7R8VBW1_TIMDO|nr:unnamed protein product [Timema douglasi]